jgi:hypothetical protein
VHKPRCCEHRHFELLVRNIVTKEITEESAVRAGWFAGRGSVRRTWRGFDSATEEGGEGGVAAST